MYLYFTAKHTRHYIDVLLEFKRIGLLLKVISRDNRLLFDHLPGIGQDFMTDSSLATPTMY